MLAVGDRAPDFTAPADGGGTLRLRDFRGSRVVLYFYPKDNTPGCTQEACDFRDRSAEFDAAGAAVVGVSPDSVPSHDRFKQKHSLPFRLISDEDHRIADAYGVWREKSLYGRKYFGVVRSTFLIDEKGRLAALYDKVRVKGHVEDVLAKL